MAEQLLPLFSSRWQQIVNFDLFGDKAKVEKKYEAVLACNFPNGMKTGDTLQLDGQS